jgi:broad specificity phosphatase PhoE
MTLFYLVRHGEPLWSMTKERRLKGAQRDLAPGQDIGHGDIVEWEQNATTPHNRA